MIKAEDAKQLMRTSNYNCWRIADMQGNLLAEHKEKEGDMETAIARLDDAVKIFSHYNRLVMHAASKLSESSNWTGSKRWIIETPNAGSGNGQMMQPMQMGAGMPGNSPSWEQYMDLKIECIKLQMEQKMQGNSEKSELEKYVPSRYLDLGIMKALGMSPQDVVAWGQMQGMSNIAQQPQPMLNGTAAASPTQIPSNQQTYKPMAEVVFETDRKSGETNIGWTEDQLTALEGAMEVQFQQKIDFNKFFTLIQAISKQPQFVDIALQFMMQNNQQQPGS